jgi:hypothetical protein
MPRMTNTFMLSGTRDPEEIIASVDRGIYAANFGGGQVDTEGMDNCRGIMGQGTQPRIFEQLAIGHGTAHTGQRTVQLIP